MRLVLSLLAFVTLTLVASAAPSAARKAIAAAYEKTAQAVNVKYVDGLVAFRSRDFKAYRPDGVEADLSDEFENYRSLLTPALSARKIWKFLDFQETSPTQVVCRVHEVIKMRRLHPETGKKVTLALETRSRYLWVKLPEGWRQKTCHVESQTLGLIDE